MPRRPHVEGCGWVSICRGNRQGPDPLGPVLGSGAVAAPVPALKIISLQLVAIRTSHSGDTFRSIIVLYHLLSLHPYFTPRVIAETHFLPSLFYTTCWLHLYSFYTSSPHMHCTPVCLFHPYYIPRPTLFFQPRHDLFPSPAAHPPQGDDGRPPAHATSARGGPGGPGGGAWGAALSVGAASLWAKAATATSEIVKDLTKPPRYARPAHPMLHPSPHPSRWPLPHPMLRPA